MSGQENKRESLNGYQSDSSKYILKFQLSKAVDLRQESDIPSLREEGIISFEKE